MKEDEHEKYTLYILCGGEACDTFLNAETPEEYYECEDWHLSTPTFDSKEEADAFIRGLALAEDGFGGSRDPRHGSDYLLLNKEQYDEILKAQDTINREEEE